jgi:PPOX class probable F420-dependent enzyme
VGDAVSAFSPLDGARYLLLTTYRESGEPVATPVWFARTASDRVVFTTDARAGKVKRLDRDPRCTVAPCDVRGRTDATAIAARGRLLAGDEAAEADRALARTYGLTWRLFHLAARLRGRRAAERVHFELAAA